MATDTYPLLGAIEVLPGYAPNWAEADAWMLKARDRVLTHPHYPGAEVVPFGGDAFKFGGHQWVVSGVGILVAFTDGGPDGSHLPDKVGIGRMIGPEGESMLVSTWYADRPVFVHAWEMLIHRPGTPTTAHVWWRPNLNTPNRPRCDIPNAFEMSRRQARAFEDALRDWLRGKEPRGRGRLDPEQVKTDLYAALKRYRDANNGDYPSNYAEELGAFIIPPKSRDAVLDWVALLRTNNIPFPPPD